MTDGIGLNDPIAESFQGRYQDALFEFYRQKGYIVMLLAGRPPRGQ